MLAYSVAGHPMVLVMVMVFQGPLDYFCILSIIIFAAFQALVLSLLCCAGIFVMVGADLSQLLRCLCHV